MNAHSIRGKISESARLHARLLSVTLLGVATASSGARAAQAFYPFDVAPTVSVQDGTFLGCPTDQQGAENLCGVPLQELRLRFVSFRNGTYGVDANGDGARDGTLTMEADLFSEVSRLPDGRYHYIWKLTNLGSGAFTGFLGNNTPQFVVTAASPLLGSAGVDRVAGTADDQSHPLYQTMSLDSEFAPGSEAFGIVANPSTGLVATLLVPLSDLSGPKASIVGLTPNPASIGGTRTLLAGIDDVDSGGSTIANASFRIDAGPWEALAPGDGVFDEVIEAVSASLPGQTSADVQEVCVRGTDSRGNTGEPECVIAVSYDPNGGFVTGGGWLGSSEPTDRIGFVAKYQKNSTSPEGQLEFQTTDFNFHSASFQWLVVIGNEALLQGGGTINGTGTYGFLLHVLDASSGDRIRVQIWDSTNQMVYDNEVGAESMAIPVTPLAGGQVIVHSAKK